MLAGVKLGEEVDELPHLLLLGTGGVVGVVRRHGVQECPGVSAKLLAVEGTVRRWLFLLRDRGVLEQEKGL